MTGGDDVIFGVNTARRSLLLSTSNVANTQFSLGDAGVGELILNTTRTGGPFVVTYDMVGDMIFRAVVVRGSAADVATVVETFDLP